MDKYFRLKNLSTGGITTLTQSSITIGRGRFNYLQVDSNLLSSQHATIKITSDKAVIEDLNSTNGTLINGMPISAITELMHGDVIGLGDDRFMLIAPNKHDDATVFSLNMGGALLAPVSKIAELNAGTLSAVEAKQVTEGILAFAIKTKAIKKFDHPGAVLITLTKSILGDTFEFESQTSGVNRWFIGRDPSFSACIDNPTVSVNHATLSFESGIWTIKDNGSTNGTKLNGKRVLQSECKNGDLLSLGKLNCVFGVIVDALEPVE